MRVGRRRSSIRRGRPRRRQFDEDHRCTIREARIRYKRSRSDAGSGIRSSKALGEAAITASFQQWRSLPTGATRTTPSVVLRVTLAAAPLSAARRSSRAKAARWIAGRSRVPKSRRQRWRARLSTRALWAEGAGTSPRTADPGETCLLATHPQIRVVESRYELRLQLRCCNTELSHGRVAVGPLFVAVSTRSGWNYGPA
jgi:hypothetical protein